MNVEEERPAGLEFADLLADEHPISTENDHLFALEYLGDELTQSRIDHRLSAADRDNRRAALIDGVQALINRQLLLDRRFVFPDPAAPRAGQVAGVKRL